MNTLWLIGWLITVGYILREIENDGVAIDTWPEVASVILGVIVTCIFWPLMVGAILFDKTKHL